MRTSLSPTVLLMKDNGIGSRNPEEERKMSIKSKDLNALIEAAKTLGGEAAGDCGVGYAYRVIRLPDGSTITYTFDRPGPFGGCEARAQRYPCASVPCPQQGSLAERLLRGESLTEADLIPDIIAAYQRREKEIKDIGERWERRA